MADRQEARSAASALRVVPHGEQVSFAEFCERHNIKLVAHERSKRSGLPPWYVSPQGLVEIREGGFLTSVHGSGETPEEALADYERRLAGHRLLIGGAYEVVAPNEWRAA